jgi:hypothetical protein
MTPIVGIAAGLGLAAASGFRAFVPLLLMSLFVYRRTNTGKA